MNERTDKNATPDPDIAFGDEHLNLDLNISINQREFGETPVRYATVAHVSFDGVNFHLVFLATTPLPLVGEGPSENVPAQVVARIVLPPTAALTTTLLLRDAIEQNPSQPLIPMPGQSIRPGQRDE